MMNPDPKKSNTKIGHVPGKTSGISGGKAKGAHVDKRGTGDCSGSKVAWGRMTGKGCK